MTDKDVDYPEWFWSYEIQDKIMDICGIENKQKCSAGQKIRIAKAWAKIFKLEKGINTGTKRLEKLSIKFIDIKTEFDLEKELKLIEEELKLSEDEREDDGRVAEKDWDLIGKFLDIDNAKEKSKAIKDQQKKIIQDQDYSKKYNAMVKKDAETKQKLYEEELAKLPKEPSFNKFSRNLKLSKQAIKEVEERDEE